MEPAPLWEIDSWLDRFRGFWEPRPAALGTEIAGGKRKRGVEDPPTRKAASDSAGTSRRHENAPHPCLRHSLSGPRACSRGLLKLGCWTAHQRDRLAPRVVSPLPITNGFKPGQRGNGRETRLQERRTSPLHYSTTRLPIPETATSAFPSPAAGACPRAGRRPDPGATPSSASTPRRKFGRMGQTVKGLPAQVHLNGLAMVWLK